MKRMYAFLILVLPLLALNGCGQTSGNGAPVATGQATFVANFDPTNSIIPFPDDLLFTGTLDGTLNIPVVDPTDFGDPKVAMNALDGFSTIAPISTTFATAANAATIIAGTTLHVYEVTVLDARGAVTGIVRELTAAEYTASLSATDATGKTLVIQPRAVLKSNTRYMVVLTGGIKSTTGLPLIPSSTFGLTKGAAPLVDGAGNSLFPVLTNAQAVALEPLRQLTRTYLGAAAGAGVPSSAVALAWTFKTQTINSVLAKIQADSVAKVASPANFITFPVAPSAATGGLGVLPMATFAAANGLPAKSFLDVASVVIGAIKVPYYLSTDGKGNLAKGILPGAVTAHFAIVPATGLPKANPALETIPFLMTVPNTKGSWPVVILQHGFTASKSSIFGIADKLAKFGFATIAIDSVLHGDRTFKLNLITQALDKNGNPTGPALVDPKTKKPLGPDKLPDSSGTWYLNIGHLLTTRDNARQSVADLIHLTRLLELEGDGAAGRMDLVNNKTGVPGADGVPDLKVKSSAALTNPPISYVGHSNGGILGTMLAAVEPAIKTFVLANPGGIYSNIFLNSAEVGPLVKGGLASKGVLPGSSAFNAFFVAAQTVGDDADPVNYGRLAAAAGKNILMFKQMGDLVVPNSSTDALAAAFGMKQVAAAVAVPARWPLGEVPSPFIGNGFTFFTKGTHSSFLKPDQAPADPASVGLDVLAEMQAEAATYLSTALPPTSAAAVTISGAAKSGAAITTIMQ